MVTSYAPGVLRSYSLVVPPTGASVSVGEDINFMSASAVSKRISVVIVEVSELIFGLISCFEVSRLSP